MIGVMAKGCRVVGLEGMSEQLLDTEFTQEFLDKESAGIGGEISAIEINFDLSIAI